MTPPVPPEPPEPPTPEHEIYFLSGNNATPKQGYYFWDTLKYDGENYHVKLVLKDDDLQEHYVTGGFLITSQYAEQSIIGVGVGNYLENTNASKVNNEWAFSTTYPQFANPNPFYLVYDSDWNIVSDFPLDLGGTTSYEFTWPS